MKTPMQELIEQLKELQKTYTQFADSYTAYTLHNVIELAESLLEKEKEVMCEFAKYCLDKALDLDVRTAFSNVEEYYNETFKTKKR